MPQWLSDILERSNFFMPHGHCYLWIPSLLWMHVLSDALIGFAYLGISLLLYVFVRKIRLPFSPVFIAFGLFIGLCGLTHFLSVWTVWNPDYFIDGIVKSATAAASVATAIGLLYVRPQIEAVVHTARLSEERRVQLESKNAELEALYRKIMQLDEAKTQFFANVSHELRTPLTLIMGPSERMLADENLTTAQKKELQTVVKNSKLLLKQVNDLLEVAKLEAGRMTVTYARMDLASWFRRVVSHFETAASMKRIDYHASAPSNLVAEVDPEMLERVLVNLLSNAFKFTPEGGRIEVRLASEADAVRVSVQDTGPGIAAQEHESVFERFRQSDGGATRKHGGTGLGLAIAKELTELHGGRILLTSAPGEGARFDVVLPARAPVSAGIEEVSAEHASSSTSVEIALQELTGQHGDSGSLPLDQSPGRSSVLVVEDNPDVRDFIASTLSTSHNVVTAVDGQEGIDRALAMRPDLIVSDIMMPRKSGDQLVEELRSRSEFDNVPILLLSAKNDDEQRIALLRSGAQDYLTKPFLPQELVARATNLITLKRVGDLLRSSLDSAAGDVQSLARELAAKHTQLRAALEAVSIARDHAEQANEVKSQFLAMISHELRTPLSNIHMNLRLLERTLPQNAADQSVLVRLRRAATQMSSLIEGLLEHTRVESGKLTIHSERIDLVGLAQELVDAHAENVVGEVELTLSPPPNPLPTLISDPRLLRVVLDNLISNALKFTKEGRVIVSVAGTETSSTIQIHDTGIGISAADLPRIFEPFEQLEPVRRKSIPGVGLGLSLVKHIVEALHGTVEVESSPGQGSVFRVHLPSMPN